ncbi:MAG: CHASE domain-containing protein [Xanthobacteraceae bacterium]|nr:CHASE domain-containing protein [Xanthobacteraceae bacterium]
MDRTRAAIAICGLVSLAIVALIATQDYLSARAGERQRVEALIEQHFLSLSNHLRDRVGIARSVGAVFKPSSRLGPHSLGGIDEDFLAGVPDITSIVWVPAVARHELAEVRKALSASGVDSPALIGAGRRPIGESDLGETFHPVMDIAPRTKSNLSSLGLVLSALPMPREALDRAATSQRPSATAPLTLVQLPGVPAFVIYVPVRHLDGKAEQRLEGFLGFSYRYHRLVEEAVSARPDWPFFVRLLDADAPHIDLYRSADQPPAATAAPLAQTRTIEFAGRTWQVEYRAPVPTPVAGTLQVATLGSISVLTMTFAALFIAGAYRKLEVALGDLTRADASLQVVVRELNHRLKNVLTVVQSVAHRTFRNADPQAACPAFLGRIAAMAHSADLLVKSQSGGVSLRELIAAIDGCDDRVATVGPDMALTPVGAQNMALMIYELWTNAVKYGALSAEQGKVLLRWSETGDRFVLDWIELDGPPAQRPQPDEAGFGKQLLNELVPRAFGGSASLEFLAEGFRYHLEADAALVSIRTDARGPEDGESAGPSLRGDSPGGERDKGSTVPAGGAG